MMRRMTWVGALGCAMALVGCGDDDVAPGGDAGGIPADSGGGGDSGGRDAGGGRDSGTPAVLGTCAMPQTVMGTIGTVMVDFDTTGGPVGPLDFGACGPAIPGTMMLANPPQTVIAYQVPGTGAVALDFTLINSGTPATYDTLVEVRYDGMCTTTPVAAFPPFCFDDTQTSDPMMPDPRGTGTVGATGGETVFFIISGYAGTPFAGTTSEGAGRIDITARTNNAPTVTAGDVRVFAGRTEVEVTGMDADGDALGVKVTFLDAMGMPVDLDGSGMVDAGDDTLSAFDDSVAGMMSFTGVVTLADFDTAMATQARIQVFDEGFALSTPPTMVPLRALTEAVFGGACSATMICPPTLVCDATAMTCGPDMAHATACMGATAITVPFPTDSMSTGMRVTGSIPMGSGIFSGSCGGPGPESLFTLTVPGTAGVPTSPVDIVLSTDVTETGMKTDTVLYVRGTCGNPASEPMGACNDDISAMNTHSRVEIRGAEARTYTIAVDLFAGGATMGPTPFGLQVTYRPVLAMGVACDPMGLENRCAGAACPAGMTPTCP